MNARKTNGFALGKLTGLTWDEIQGHAAEITRADGDVFYSGRFLCTVFNDADGGDVLDEDENSMSDADVQAAIDTIDETQSHDMHAEAIGFAECYLEWFNSRHAEFFRGADIFRDRAGEYRLISSGCGVSGVHKIVCENLSADLFGDTDETTTVEELAATIVDGGWLQQEIKNAR